MTALFAFLLAVRSTLLHARPLPGEGSVCVFAVFLSSVVACSSVSHPAIFAGAPPDTGSLGDVWTRTSDEMAMVFVPTGLFEMGNSDGEPDEQPVHTIKLDAFWIDQTEVTNAQYRRCVRAGACEPPTNCEWGKPTYDDGAKSDHPVVCVDWHGARAYCAWAGARLPTEAEWEYAARGPQGDAYPWGSAFDCSRGNFDDETWIHELVVPGGKGCDGFEKTAPVGSFEAGASWVGALDMAGNVWEWVADWYGSYPSAAQINPIGPSEGDFKVLKGSAWIIFHPGTHAALRHRDVPDSRNRNAGFRCAASPIESSH